MNILELFLIAVGLSIDAFAISICHGLSMKKASLKKAFIIGLYFGISQAVMPLIGYFVGSRFSDMIASVGHWIAFALLAFIGARMIAGSFKKDDHDTEIPEEASLKPATMLPLAIATSIDALAVGVTFALLQVEIFRAVSLIGVTTLVISMCGVAIGNVFGTRFKSKAEFAGGAILILMGLKLLLNI